YPPFLFPARGVCVGGGGAGGGARGGGGGGPPAPRVRPAPGPPVPGQLVRTSKTVPSFPLSSTLYRSV
ncbi:MAG TPA: hypothetical protein DCY69_00320, partial [Acidimicrobiaceae bacterium]|nr:hypothetical protein [Acidimicrobiaceae bacterium]